MTTDPSLFFPAFVSLMAVLLCLYMAMTVSAMRDRFGVAPPAVSGAPEFERAFRAHQNTLEALPVFLIPMWLAALYFRPWNWLPPLIGMVWIAGRLLYMRGYIAAAERRGMGLRIQALALLVNIILAFAGIAMAKLAAPV